MSSNYSCCGLTGKQKQEEIVGKENKRGLAGRERNVKRERTASHMNSGMRFVSTHNTTEGVKLLPVKQKESDRTIVSWKSLLSLMSSTL